MNDGSILGHVRFPHAGGSYYSAARTKLRSSPHSFFLLLLKSLAKAFLTSLLIDVG